MGATALANRKHRTSQSTSVFGIGNARKLTDKAPREADFRDQGKDDIRIAVASEEEKDIIFQFKLSKDGSEMIIRAYDPNIPTKSATEVKTSSPSLNSVINDPNASPSDKSGALKIRDMMNRSKSGIKESSLARIANELEKKRAKGGRRRR